MRSPNPQRTTGVNSLHKLKLRGEARETGDASSSTQSRVLVRSKGREPGHSALPFGSLSTVPFAQGGKISNRRTDFIPEKHRALIRNAEHSAPSKLFQMPRMRLITSDSCYQIRQTEWDKPRGPRFYQTVHMCMDMALPPIMVISCGSFLVFF